MRADSSKHRTGFTLIELILVLVIMVTLVGISMPYFAGTLRGLKLRTSARTITRMANHARGLAIMREETVAMAINHEKMEIYLGGLTGASSTTSTNTADGELDQDVLDRLGYTDGDENAAMESGSVDREIFRSLPEGLSVVEFNKDVVEDEEDILVDIYVVRFFPNGQCEWFELELEDQRGMGVKLENDPISGRISSEFTQ